MRIVLDTNVFVSGIFWRGISTEILKLWQKHAFILCISPNIFDEYERITKLLAQRYTNSKPDLFLELVTSSAEFFPDISLPQSISRDLDDDKFIACALSASAELIVSGDKDLLDIQEYCGIEILTPKNFLLRLMQ